MGCQSWGVRHGVDVRHGVSVMALETGHSLHVSLPLARTFVSSDWRSKVNMSLRGCLFLCPPITYSFLATCTQRGSMRRGYVLCSINEWATYWVVQQCVGHARHQVVRIGPSTVVRPGNVGTVSAELGPQ